MLLVFSALLIVSHNALTTAGYLLLIQGWHDLRRIIVILLTAIIAAHEWQRLRFLYPPIDRLSLSQVRIDLFDVGLLVVVTTVGDFVFQ